MSERRTSKREFGACMACPHICLGLEIAWAGDVRAVCHSMHSLYECRNTNFYFLHQLCFIHFMSSVVARTCRETSFFSPGKSSHFFPFCRFAFICREMLFKITFDLMEANTNETFDTDVDVLVTGVAAVSVYLEQFFWESLCACGLTTTEA